LDRFDTVRSIVASTKAANDFEISFHRDIIPKDPLLNRVTNHDLELDDGACRRLWTLW